MPKTFTDLMIDLETLGKTPGSVITQIGLVSFNTEGDLTDMAANQIQVDVQSSLDAGLTMDWDTIRWWMQQEDKAREQMVLGGMPLGEAISLVNNYIRENHDFVGDTRSLKRVWGYASTFDIVLLQSAARAVGEDLLWTYQEETCLRTLAKRFPKVERPEPEVKHIASFDAIAQARWAQRISTHIAEIEDYAWRYRELQN